MSATVKVFVFIKQIYIYIFHVHLIFPMTAILDAVVFALVVFQNEIACEVVDHQIEAASFVVQICLLCLIIKESNVYIKHCTRV